MIRAPFRPTPAKAGGEPESRNFKDFWMPASAGMTAERRRTYLNQFQFQSTSLILIAQLPVCSAAHRDRRPIEESAVPESRRSGRSLCKNHHSRCPISSFR